MKRKTQKTKIVLGLGFGDEGKGVTTDFLCRQAERPLVVRFSGGHQAGHTVTLPDGRSHVFSNFGAGTLAGAPTFWSRYCTFHPVGYANERLALEAMGFPPELYVDERAPVTTPYDLLYNRHRERKQRHGSCGLGFGATVARHEGPHKLHVLDLFDDFVLERKLRSVASYYGDQLGAVYDKIELDAKLTDFWAAVRACRTSLHRTCGRAHFADCATYDQLIFEGSQGLLLDQEFGYFPHVTRAYVSSRNALEMIAAYDLPAPELYYVTRAYQTRHGNGPLTNTTLPGPELTPTPKETNVYNPWQGHQRRSLLDLDQLRFALRADAQYSAGLPRHLVVTCLDQLRGDWRSTDGAKTRELSSVKDLAFRLAGAWKGVYENRGPVGAW
ncbi:MAG: adenylosuccinate synthetase [Bacteroidota bacterium]